MGAVARALDDLALEHLTSAAWAWHRRRSVVGSRVWGLDALSLLDEHTRAHVEGLLAAGPIGWEALDEGMRWNDPGVTFTAIVLAGLSGNRDRLEAIVSEHPGWEHQEAVVSGLAWLPRPLALPVAHRWLGYDHGRWRALALAVHVEHRQDPRGAIDRGLLDSDGAVRLHAARACGVFGRRMLIPTLWALHEDSADEVDFEIARALLMLDAHGAARLMWDQAREGGALAEEAADLAMRHVASAVAHQWLQEGDRRPGLARARLAGAAGTGLPALASDLIDAVDDPELGQLAALGLRDAFGLDLGQVPTQLVLEDAEPGPIEIDVEWIRVWWAALRRVLDPRQPRILGVPRDRIGLRHALRRGSQWLRAHAALDLLRHAPRQAAPFAPGAPAWRQRFWLRGTNRLLADRA